MAKLSSTLRTTVILVLIFVGLLAYVFYIREKGDEPVPEGEVEVVQVWDFEVGEISSIKVSGEGKEVELTKDGESWQITRPLEAEANKGKVERILGLLADLTTEHKIEGGELTEYGLSEPAKTVELKIGEETKKISFGDESVFGSMRYAKVDDEDFVFLVSPSTADDFGVSEKDYRQSE